MATSTVIKNSTILFTDLEVIDKTKIMDASNVRNPSCMLSSTSLDGNITNYTFPETNSELSVTAILNYCKNKILNPYLRLLSIVGLRPILTNQQEPNLFLQLINLTYSILLVLLLIIGYVLQYMACFRRDRGFCYKIPEAPYIFQAQIKQQIYEQICHGPLLFSFIIPSCLHLSGYLYAISTMRHSDDDQLPVLMERVFLSSVNLSSQKKLVRTLWTFVVFTTIWMVLSLIVVNFMMVNGTINFKWIEHEPFPLTNCLKILLIVGTLWQDIAQATIISNYCLQAQLLTAYLQFLQEKLLQSSIQPLEWIRHIETFKKMLTYMNTEVAPSVCILTFMNMSCAISGLVWLLHFDNVDKETVPIMGISIINVALWIVLALAPFIQASRLSNECNILRNVGQEVRTRPFAHQDTPRHELDSILLYSASLKLRANLFYVPITGKYLCLFFMITGICVLVLGQCHYFN